MFTSFTDFIEVESRVFVSVKRTLRRRSSESNDHGRTGNGYHIDARYFTSYLPWSLRFRFSTLKRTRSEENTEDANSPEFSFRVLSSTYRKQNPIELFVCNELERAPMKFSLKEIQLRLKTVIDSYEYNL